MIGDHTRRSVIVLRIIAVLAGFSGAHAAPGGEPVDGFAAGRLTLEEFEKLHREVRPLEGEVWRTIPWKLSLLDAQRLAATEQKPIFLWAMASNPLGCV